MKYLCLNSQIIKFQLFLLLSLLILNLSSCMKQSYQTKISSNKNKSISTNFSRDNLLNSNNIFVNKKEGKVRSLFMIKKNQILVTTIFAVCLGFIFGTTFITILFAYSKENYSELSNASIQIVKSFNEFSNLNKIIIDDVLTNHII
jgi:hypothetical protein